MSARIVFPLPFFKMSLLKLKFFFDTSLLDLLIYVSLLKLVMSYFIPVNVLVHAPHDDYLFYRLSQSIGNFDWLGVYDQLTLMKGAGFPLFLSLVKFTGLPLRVLEAVYICFATGYLISSPLFSSIRKPYKVFLFSLIVFIPFQYTAFDFRLLRDMVYPWTLILMIGACGYIIFNFIHKNKYLIHCVAFGLALGFFDITREETIWILPGVLFITLIIVFCCISAKRFPDWRSVVAFAICGCAFPLLVVGANYLVYDTTIRTEFREGGFPKGYGRLFRFKDNTDIPRASLTSEAWERLFTEVPESRPLQTYVESPAYNGWVATSCNAIRSQHPWEDNSRCDNVMLNGYLMMAMKDALFSAGFNTPVKQSDFMNDLAKAIDDKCSQENIPCKNPAHSMMPPETLELDTLLAMVRNLPRAYKVMTSSNNPQPSSVVGSGPIATQIAIGKNLSAKVFGTFARPNAENNISISDRLFEQKLPESVGYVDGVRLVNGSLQVFGWVKPSLDDPKIVASVQKNACRVEPNIKRVDVTNEKPVGFVCSLFYDVETIQPIDLNIAVINRTQAYSLTLTDDVASQLRNEFDEDCYLSANPDVASAVDRGEFVSGRDHFEKFGAFEQRACKPLTVPKYSANIANLNTIKGPFSDVALSTNQVLGYMYQNINFYGWFLPLVVFFVALFLKQFSINLLILGLAGLTLTRLTLISLLDYTGMAPITALYLYSGTVLWLLLIGFSLMFLSQLVVDFGSKYVGQKINYNNSSGI